jgi:hypothetical protein
LSGPTGMVATMVWDNTLVSQVRRVARALGDRVRGSPLPWVLSAYAVLTVVFTWPVAASFTTRLGGEGADLRVAFWDMWWFERAVLEGHRFLKTPYLYYPGGVELNYHSISWGSAAVAFPFRRLFGPIGGYNAMTLIQTFLCAVSMYLLAAYVVRRTAPAFLAGVVLAFEPSRFGKSMHQPNLASTAFIPLVFLGLLRAWRERQPAWMLLAAASLGLVLLHGAHLFLMTCMAVAFLAVWELVGSRRARDPSFWRANLTFGLACVPCVGPWLLPFVSSNDALDSAIQSVPPSGSTTDPLGFFLPGLRHWLLGDAVRPLHALVGKGASSVPYLGLFALGLVIFGLVARRTRRATLVWAVGLAGFLALSLGGRLRLAGDVYDVPLPYSLVSWMRPIQAVRGPNRFNLVARPFLAMACAWGLAAAIDALRGRRVALGLVPLVMLDYLSIPYPTQRLEESAFFRKLARAKRGALIELPLDRGAGKIAMRSQTVHGRPIAGGMVARLPPSARRYIQSSSLLRALEGGAPQPLDCSRIPLRKELETLQRDGFHHIVIRAQRATLPQRRIYRGYFGRKPSFEDREISVYALEDLLKAPLRCDRFHPEPPGKP